MQIQAYFDTPEWGECGIPKKPLVDLSDVDPFLVKLRN
jgi:hypothetical protein